jgi:hypothetical protein
MKRGSRETEYYVSVRPDWVADADGIRDVTGGSLTATLDPAPPAVPEPMSLILVGMGSPQRRRAGAASDDTLKCALNCAGNCPSARA